MNNERYNQIIDEVYMNYTDSHWTSPEDPNSKLLVPQIWSLKPMQHNKESFIHEIKTNPKFSKNWDLKIEETKLSLENRILEFAKRDLDVSEFRRGGNYGIVIPEEKTLEVLNKHNIPTKLIIVTYKDEKIEVYE